MDNENSKLIALPMKLEGSDLIKSNKVTVC